VELDDLRPLPGGWSGDTFLAEWDGRTVVVRRYRDDRVPVIDAAILQRAAALVPVPQVLDVRAGQLVTAYVEGVRGDLLVPTLDEAGLATLGADVGRIAATLAATSTPRPGLFSDDQLHIEPFALDLAGWVAEHPRAWMGWSAAERRGLMSVAEEAHDRLVAVGRSCFVHSDLNPKNLIVDPDSLTVAAVLDWEFAHSGNPYTDLGNAVRFERHPAWVEAAVSTYAGHLGEEPHVALDLARRADLWALVELAARRGQHPIADQAHDLLRAIAAVRDAHAVPADWANGT
jgi:aminoglycoside phosphotransferase (APT) family kinase protein